MGVFGWYSTAGAVKPTNQDACCYKSAHLASGGMVSLAVVCDGVGGLSAGELASSTVVKRFSDWFDERFGQTCTFLPEDWDAVHRTWSTMLDDVNRDLLEYSRSEGIRLGSTLTAMLAYGNAFLIVQVGDCRAYRICADSCEQLTNDQTLVAQQVREGALSQAQADVHPQRNVITQAVGAQSELAPEWSKGTIRSDDVFVLCCDGFYAMQKQEDLITAFSFRDDRPSQWLSDACFEMVQQVMGKGEQDNITVIAFSPSICREGDRLTKVSCTSGDYSGVDVEDENNTIVL